MVKGRAAGVAVAEGTAEAVGEGVWVGLGVRLAVGVGVLLSAGTAQADSRAIESKISSMILWRWIMLPRIPKKPCDG